MSARSFERGWPIIFKNGKWVYEDTGKPVVDNRPCPRCDKMPTLEGYDACLGYMPGVKAACCGHGVGESYIMELIK